MISVRHPFTTVNWNGKYGHVNTKGCINTVVMILVEKKDNAIGKKNSTNILNFFTVTKIKKELSTV